MEYKQIDVSFEPKKIELFKNFRECATARQIRAARWSKIKGFLKKALIK